MLSRRDLIAIILASCIGTGLPSFAALAKDGEGGNSGPGGGDDGDDGDDHSGPGGGDDDGEDDGDDHSGPGGGDDDDDDDDDHSGPGGSSGSNSGNGSGHQGQGGDGDGRLGRNAIVFSLRDGGHEGIRDGRFVIVDGQGQRVADRRATSADLARLQDALRTLGRGLDGKRVETAVVVDSAGRIHTLDPRGWRELISGGLYVLTDPRGNTVTRRTLQDKDIARVRAMMGF